MRIKKRLRINAVVSLLIAFVIGLVLALAFYQLNKANKSAIISGKIITGSFERVSLRNDYIRSNSERAKDQWFDTSLQISKLLKSAPEYFQRSEDKKIIAKLIAAQESLNEIFTALVANREKNYLNAGLAGLPLEVEERLLNQLNMKVYEGVLQCRALQESSRAARVSALRLAEGGVASALLVIIAAALINLWSMGRVITDRVNRLRSGAVMIGGGDLEHLIDIKGDDEFAELSEAFNAMTAKLSSSYHDLEVEIEERKQAEEALRQSEERHRLLSDTMLQGVVHQDANGKIISMNPAAERILGKSREQFLGSNSVQEEHGCIRENGEIFLGQEHPVMESFRTGLPTRNVIMGVFNPKLDQYRWINIDAVPVFLADEIHPSEVYTMFDDITERRRTEETLRKNEKQLGLVLQASSMGTFEVDLQTGEGVWNDVEFELLGLKPGDAPSNPETFFQHVHPDDIEAVKGNWEDALQLGELDTEFRIVRADGQERWVAGKGRFLYADKDKNQAMQFLGVNFDITERKRAEEQIKKSLAEKEVMLKEIHHRVKNNLQVISSLVSLQADSLTDERIRDELNDVRDRVRSMALIHEKLYQTSDLAQLNFADYAVSLLRSLWSSHGLLAEKVRLNLELAPVKLSVEAAVPCGLILNELAGNALKHAFPNGNDGEVTVGLEHDATTGTACLRVRDNGVGLPEGLDWRQSRSLGLRLVQILTSQLRGTVETKVDSGTEFQVAFPLNGLQS